TSDCEPFSVNKAGSSTATTIHNAAHQAIIGPAALGSTVHDQATVTSANTSFKPTGVVTFTFWRGTDACPDPATTTPDAPAASVTRALAMNVVAHPHDSTGPSAGADYPRRPPSFPPRRSSDLTSDCEPFSVNQAGSSTATTIHNAAHQAIIGPAALGSTVHDQ